MNVLNKTFLLRLFLYASLVFLLMYGWRLSEVQATGIFWPAVVSVTIPLVGMLAVQLVVLRNAEK